MDRGTNVPKDLGILINIFFDIEYLFLDALQSKQVIEKFPTMKHSNDHDNEYATARWCLQWLEL